MGPVQMASVPRREFSAFVQTVDPNPAFALTIQKTGPYYPAVSFTHISA